MKEVKSCIMSKGHKSVLEMIDNNYINKNSSVSFTMGIIYNNKYRLFFYNNKVHMNRRKQRNDLTLITYQYKYIENNN